MKNDKEKRKKTRWFLGDEKGSDERKKHLLSLLQVLLDFYLTAKGRKRERNMFKLEPKEEKKEGIQNLKDIIVESVI